MFRFGIVSSSCNYSVVWHVSVVSSRETTTHHDTQYSSNLQQLTTHLLYCCSLIITQPIDSIHHAHAVICCTLSLSLSLPLPLFTVLHFLSIIISSTVCSTDMIVYITSILDVANDSYRERGMWYDNQNTVIGFAILLLSYIQTMNNRIISPHMVCNFYVPSSINCSS